MWPWRSFIHICGCNGSVISSFFDQLINLLRRRNVILCQIFNKNPSLFIRSDLQVRFIWINQISQFFHVKLNKWHFYSELDVLSAWSNRIKNVSDHTWNYAWLYSNLFANLSLHGVCFSWRCLTICKYRSIETLNDTVHNRSSSIFINICLFGTCIKNFIEREFQTIFQIFDVGCFYSNCFFIKQLMRMGSSQSFLSFVDRSESTDDFNIGCSCDFLRTGHYFWKWQN